MAWSALGVTALALVALVLVVPVREGSVAASPHAGSFSTATRSALATLIGDDEVLRSERGQIRRALEIHREALPPGAAEALLSGLSSLDDALEKLTRAWRERPTDVQVMAEMARVWQQRVQLIERADALVRRASGSEGQG